MDKNVNNIIFDDYSKVSRFSKKDYERYYTTNRKIRKELW